MEAKEEGAKKRMKRRGIKHIIGTNLEGTILILKVIRMVSSFFLRKTSGERGMYGIGNVPLSLLSMEKGLFLRRRKNKVP